MSSVSKNVKRKILDSIVGLAALGALLSLSAIFSKYNILFDLLSHFRVQYIVLLIPAFVFAVYAKKTKSLLVICLALAVHGYSLTMSLLPESMPATVSDSADFVEIKVLNSNLLLVNTHHDAQIQFIESIDPDIIAFQEYTQDWHTALSERLTQYPHRVTEPTPSPFGIALYSKHPIVSGGIELLSQNSTLAANVEIDIDGKLVRVIGVHPPPPMSIRMYDMRNELMQEVGRLATQEEDALIVMGDFNATPWTTHFSDMMSAGKLRNARGGQGMHPTWPTNNFILQIPIDHILVNAKVAVKEFASERVIGSDHRTVWSRLHVY